MKRKTEAEKFAVFHAMRTREEAEGVAAALERLGYTAYVRASEKSKTGRPFVVWVIDGDSQHVIDVVEMETSRASRADDLEYKLSLLKKRVEESRQRFCRKLKGAVERAGLDFVGWTTRRGEPVQTVNGVRVKIAPAPRIAYELEFLSSR